MRPWIAVVSTLLIVTSAGAQAPRKALEKLSAVALTPQQIATIQDGVKRKLRDPDSARFGQIVAGQNKRGVLSVCGWVNARNGFGGYAGNTTFMGIFAGKDDSKLSFLPLSIDAGKNEVAATLEICAEQGIALRSP